MPENRYHDVLFHDGDIVELGEQAEPAEDEV